MAFTEPSLNHALAEVLNDLIPSWQVSAEQTGLFRGAKNHGKQPDILFESSGDLPVVLENEYEPASTVEQEAFDRIGLVLDHSGQKLERVVALVSSTDLKSCRGMADARERLQEAQFRYALYISYERWPSSGYICGDLHDLAWFLINTSKSTSGLSESIEILTSYVNDIIELLFRVVGKNKHTMQRIAEVLKQDFSLDDPQPLGIVATVLVNAMVFQQRLAETLAVRNMDQMDIDDDLTQGGVIKEWEKILRMNYWPIFSLSRDLLYEINDANLAKQVVELVRECTTELMKLGVVNSEDLSGVVFQRFITDRKYLATFYTRPMSANLLAHLAIPTWHDPTKYRDFSIADFACGTGTLIYASYQRLSVLQQLVKGEHPEELHSHKMENSLHAADIVPSAAQMTASMLSSVFPSKTYEKSRVIVPQYGRIGETEAQNIDDVRLGSLELLDTHLQGLIPEFYTEQQIVGRIDGEG